MRRKTDTSAPPEAVDRLFLVADDEERDGRVLRPTAAAEPFDDLYLEPVRVLEFVDHDVREPPLQRFGYGGMPSQHLCREQLEVEEVEGPETSLLCAVAGAGVVEEGAEPADHLKGELVVFVPGRAGRPLAS